MSRTRLATIGAAALCCALPLTARAEYLDSIIGLTQSEFRLLSEDLGAALSYKPLVPSEGLGLTGFDIGVAVTATQLQNRAIFEKAAAGSSVPSAVPVPTLRIVKGLPLDIDIGLLWAAVPGSNINLFGGELRWAFIPGSTATPAVAVRASATSMSGVDELKLSTRSVDLSISKGFTTFTPYGGIGQVWTTSTPQGIPTLSKESFSKSKLFAGLNINFGMNIALEWDKTGDANTYGVKLGARF